MRTLRLFGAVLFALLFFSPPAALAGRLGTDVIGLFPKEVGELAYADLKTARKFKWFAQLKDQAVPTRFRQFEEFLRSAGIDPDTQVEELAWALVPATETTGEQIVGVALGQFRPAATEAFFEAQKLPTAKVRGFTLFAYGSGVGPTDIFFFFIDSNTAAFGHRTVLEKLIEVRFGAEESLLRNDKLFPLIDEVNGRGILWAVLDRGYIRLALAQVMPDLAQFRDSATLFEKIRAMTISVEAESGVDTRFQAVCETPDDANLFAVLLQAGLIYRRHQESQTNPELAQVLDGASVTPRGERLELRFAVSEEVLTSLLRRNTFAIKM